MTAQRATWALAAFTRRPGVSLGSLSGQNDAVALHVDHSVVDIVHEGDAGARPDRSVVSAWRCDLVLEGLDLLYAGDVAPAVELRLEEGPDAADGYLLAHDAGAHGEDVGVVVLA